MHDILQACGVHCDARPSWYSIVMTDCGTVACN
jgi:hypothetical protein